MDGESRLHDRLLWALLFVAGAGVALWAGWAWLQSLAPEHLVLVTLTVDPEHDTPQVLKRYAVAHRADSERRLFLTSLAPHGDRISELIEKSLLIGRPEENPQAEPGMRFQHSDRLVLVDAEGRVRGSYLCVEPVLDAERVPTSAYQINRSVLRQLRRDAVALAAGRRAGNLDHGHQIADFELIDQNGDRVTRETLKGKVWVVGFIFTRCGVSCPTITQAMNELQDPRRHALPSVNATLNGISAILLLVGFLFIRSRLILPHAICMLSAFLVSILFLGSYLYYHFAVLDGEPTRYEGPPLMRSIYLAILLSHTVLAVVVVPLVLWTLYRAFQTQFTKHARIARWTLPIWLYVSLTGVVVYLFLYRFS